MAAAKLCNLFCCPPCPGRIAAKLAFLPPEATYSLTDEPLTLNNTTGTDSYGLPHNTPSTNGAADSYSPPSTIPNGNGQQVNAVPSC